MNIRVNDDEIAIDDALTVAQLLDTLTLNAPGTALALNQTILPRAAWAQQRLSEGDELVIFQAIAGG